MIVAIIGLPGSGKSFFAAELVKKISAKYIGSDAVRDQLNLRGKYDEQTKSDVYLAMLKLMEAAISNQQNVVLDATFYKESIRALFKKKAVRQQTPLYFIEIKAAESVTKKRIEAKRKDSEANFEVYLEMKHEFQPLTEHHLVLHSDHESLNDMLKRALAYIRYKDAEK